MKQNRRVIQSNAFIKLTLLGITNPFEYTPVWISAAQIISIEENDDKTHVTVYDDCFVVKETAEEILEMMSYGNE